MASHERVILGFFHRILQIVARFCPGAGTVRVWLHRWRGVRIGKRVWIGYDAIIETAYPSLVEIRDGATIGIRATIVAHFRESKGVVIEEDAFIGPGAIIMPKVTIGKGAVVAAGSVVTTPVDPMTLVQGNPAKPIAKVGIVLNSKVSNKEFLKSLRPIRQR